MRTARSIVPVLMTVAASLSACIPEEAVFAKATPAQREAALPAGLDLEGEQAARLVTMAELDHRVSTSCPSRTVAEDTVTYEFNACAGMATGITWNGRLSAKNSRLTELLGAKVDPTKPEELRFEDLRADRPDAPFAIDGLLRRRPGAALDSVDVRNELRIDTGVSVRYDVDAICGVDGPARTCRSLPGSSGEIESIGVFELVAATRTTLGNVIGKVVLRGEDELSLDSARRDADGCIGYDVAGKPAGRICPTAGIASDTTTVEGIGWTCEGSPTDGTLELSGFAKGEPIYAKAQLRVEGVQHEIEMGLVSMDPETAEYLWRSQRAQLADVGGISCADLNGKIGVRMVAHFADGSSECHVTGDWTAFDGAACF